MTGIATRAPTRDAASARVGEVSTGTKLVAAVPWTVVTRVVTLAATVAVSSLTYRLLGSERYGLLSLLRQTALWIVTLGTFGLDQSLLRYVPLLRHGGTPGAERAFVGRTLRIQALLVLVLWGAAVLLAEPLGRLLDLEAEGVPASDLRLFLGVTGGLAAAMVYFQSLQNTSTAMFRMRSVTAASLVRGLVWFGTTAGVLLAGAAVAGVVAAEAAGFGLAAAVQGALVLREVRSRETHAAPAAPVDVSLARQLKYGAVIVASGVINLVVQRQSGAYFLARYHGLEVAGHYDLVYQYPQLALEFIPLAAAPLVLSAFSEIHARDPAALHRAMARYYRALLLLLVPLALLGACWSDGLLVLIFGDRIAADAIFANVFSVLLAIPAVYLPLSAALLTLERAHLLLPLGFVQVAINLGLSLLLIPRYGLLGAAMAVGGNLVVAVPMMLYAGARVTKGLAFPMGDLLRTCAACSPALLALPVRWLLPGPAGIVLGVLLAVALMALSLWKGPLLGAEERALLARLVRRGRAAE